MFAKVLAVAVVGAGTLALPARHASQYQPRHFRVVLERTDQGFSAACSSGCGWKTVSFGCEATCNAVIDADGVTIAPAASHRYTGFAFRLHSTLEGWKVESLGGTSWRALSIGRCWAGCRTQVDEHGITGPVAQ